MIGTNSLNTFIIVMNTMFQSTRKLVDVPTIIDCSEGVKTVSRSRYKRVIQKIGPYTVSMKLKVVAYEEKDEPKHQTDATRICRFQLVQKKFLLSTHFRICKLYGSNEIKCKNENKQQMNEVNLE